MKIKFYIKNGGSYELLEKELSPTLEWNQLKTLANSITAEIEKVRADYPEREDGFLSILSVNHRAMELLDKICRIPESIECEYCKGRMYRMPIGVVYERFNNHYVIKDNEQPSKYIYGCENCVNSISEASNEFVQRNIKERRELLEQGESWVPGKYGAWHFEFDTNVKYSKPWEETEVEPVRRTFEYIDIAGTKGEFIKIVDEYPKTGIKIPIK